MKPHSDCELPDLLEEAMQVIAVLRWPSHDDDPEVKRAAEAVMLRLYCARENALGAGCLCCARQLGRERSGHTVPTDKRRHHLTFRVNDQ